MKKIRNLCNKAYFRSKILATDLRILNSHSDYCKFVILGKGRSGSNLLRSSLDSHSQIFTFGELFRYPQSIGWGYSDYNKYLCSQRLIELMHKEPGKFLEKEVFRSFPTKISAVGFKLFYQHAKGDSREAVWDFLKNQRELKIIHLQRENLLKRLLSMKKAFITNKWSKHRNSRDRDEQDIEISLTYEECLTEFVLIQDYRLKYDDFFKGHPKIDVLYEKLADDYESEMRRIQKFLGVNHESLKPSTYKQSSHPLSKSISNYYELKEKFQGTSWSKFFED